MAMPSLKTLVGIAGVGGMTVGTMALLLLRERDKSAAKARYIKDAITTLKNEPISKELLGDNIKIGAITLKDGWSEIDKLAVRLKIPVTGDIDKAFLYAYARRPDEEERFRLYKLEAVFAKIKGKKLILMDRTDQEDIDIEDGNDKKEEEVDKSTYEPKPLIQSTTQKIREEEKKLPPEVKKQLFRDQMKDWKPVR